MTLAVSSSNPSAFQFLGRNSVGLDAAYALLWRGLIDVSIPWSEFGWFGHRGRREAHPNRRCFNSLVGIRLVWTWLGVPEVLADRVRFNSLVGIRLVWTE